jgi:predicted choloylglycine hydrolase
MELTFTARDEGLPGQGWRQAFLRFWPAYRRWFLAGGGLQTAGLATAERAFRQHMPELVPTLERLRALVDDDPLAARFLTLFRPPAFIGACSMAVVQDQGRPQLVRNYDYDPSLAEGLVLGSAWRGRRVLATSDCLWGVVDGLNEDGLALALTFGGRPEAADGFGIPIILRYVLETCRDVRDGIAALQAVPSHMAYNVTLLDRSGRHATVHLEPGGGAVVSDRPFATNHQDRVRWPAQAAFTATLERAAHLERLLAEPRANLMQSFLEPPLYRSDYVSGFGTLYTVMLDPAAGEAVYHWPGAVWRHSLEGVDPGVRQLTYRQDRGARLHGPHRELNEPWAPAGTDFDRVLDHIAAGLAAAGRPLPDGGLARLRAAATRQAPWAGLAGLFAAGPQ